MHDGLLRLARFLVDLAPVAPEDTWLRRAVSTAYYALFHKLIVESTDRVVAIAAQRPRVYRAFEHRDMLKVCSDYALGKTVSGKPPLPQIQAIANAFIDLQAARHHADYDASYLLSYPDAERYVVSAEQAFADWAAIRSHPAADEFIVELLFQSIRNR